MGVMGEFNRDALGFIERMRREYGDIVWSRFLYVPALFLYHPNEIESVLTTNARNFRKAMTLRSNFFQRLVGNGLLTSEGEEWKRQRRLSNPAFHRERVATYATTMVDYAKRLSADWQAGETRDVHRGLLTSEGEEWKRQRRLSNPAFHRERVATYATTMVDYVATRTR